MKRFLWALLALASVVTVTSPAHAVSLATLNVGWGVTSSSFLSPSTGLAVPLKFDKRLISAAVLDTTASFIIPQGPLGIAPPPASAVAADTLNIGFLRFLTDSSAAVTNTLSSITYIVEGSNDGNTWSAALASIVRTPVSGDVSFLIPVWIRTGAGFGLGPGITPCPWLAFKQYRVRTTAATGSFFAARCEFVYWTANQ